MSSLEKSHERRKFTRIPFEASVTLSNPHGKWTAKLLDISLNGILITQPHNWVDCGNKEFMIEVNFSENTLHIRMETIVSHIENKKIGLHCNHIDIDSASHLRRLVELNVGDEDILNRELSALISNAA